MSDMTLGTPQETRVATRKTAEEFFLMKGSRHAELVQGEVIHLCPTTLPHGEIAVKISYFITGFLMEHPLGKVFTEAGFILTRNPDTVRGPDVSFLSKERIPEGGLPRRGFFPGAPDLAIEVVSPGDAWAEVEEKVQEYLRAGTPEVWVVDPEHRLIRVSLGPAPGALHFYSQEQTLPSEILKGFVLSLSALFA